MSKYIYRTSITSKDGRKLYAKNYGIKAFKILIEESSEVEESSETEEIVASNVK